MTNSDTPNQVRAAIAAVKAGDKTVAELETVLGAALDSGWAPAVAVDVLRRAVEAGLVPVDTLGRLGFSEAGDASIPQSREASYKSGEAAAGQHGQIVSQTIQEVSSRLPNDAIAIGKLLGGRYRLERKLGEGGMGVVYLASDQDVKGEVFAIKVLAHETRASPEALELLREEVRKTRALVHQNIVGVYSLNVDRNDVFILMENLEGKTLRALLDEDFGRGMRFDRAWPIIEDLGEALAYAHDHSVIHGDLKPANVFVTTSAKTKLLDFGIARAARGRQWGKDAAARGALTPAYASCDMLEHLEPDTRDDIYALACTIYEMLSGRHPFDGRSAVEARDAGEKPPPIGFLTDRQNAALQQGLAFDRAARTATVEMVLAGLAQGADSDRRRVVLSKTTLLAMLVVAGAATLAYFLAENLSPRQQVAVQQRTAPIAVASSSVTTATAVSDKSIAVLPFTDLSEKKDQEYFSDGLSEELLNLLSKVRELHVAARTSAFSFKGKLDDIPTIARRLLVANILEGSVRKSGSHLRVTAQLVRADKGYHIWSETYDRKLDDIFKVQDEIARAVVTALKVSLLANEVPHSAVTKSAEAYRMLLQARFFGARGTKEDDTKALGYYREVVRLDPASAVGWAALSRQLSEMPLYGVVSWNEAREPALRAAERAVALDPNLPEAHIAIGKVFFNFDLDLPAAEAEWNAARTLDPHDSRAAMNVGDIAAIRGRLNDALELYQQASAQDPLKWWTYDRIAYIDIAMGRLADAEAAARKAVELSPTAWGGNSSLGEVLILRGRPEAGLAEIERESDELYREPALAWAYQKLGRRVDADAALARLEKSYSATATVDIATIHVLRGEPDQAFQWLDRAYQQRDASVAFITFDPDWNNLRRDPRYKAFLRKLKLLE
jgi:TolB-like protein/tetratricopeptide (TPR) repeat protein